MKNLFRVELPEQRPFLTSLALSVGIFLFFASIFNSQLSINWYSLFQLSCCGEKVIGKVIEVDSEKHNQCTVLFELNSQLIQFRPQGCKSNVGDDIVIAYNPKKPSEAVVGSPIYQLIVSILGPLFISLVAGAGLFYSLYSKMKI